MLIHLLDFVLLLFVMAQLPLEDFISQPLPFFPDCKTHLHCPL